MRKIIVILALALLGATLLGNLPSNQRVGSVTTAAGDEGGKIAYTKDGAIWLYTGGREVQLTKGPADEQDKRDAMPAFSPDGSEIAYVRFDEGFSDLYTLNVDDPSHPTALTNYRPTGVETGDLGTPGQLGYAEQALWALYPAWSPDGSTIAWTHDRGIEYPGLFLIDPDGENPRRISFLDHSTQAIERVSWSPNGTQIAASNYVGTPGETGQIWVLTLETGKWLDYTSAKDGAYDPAWSPDGKWIAFVQREGTAHNIYVMRADPADWEGDGTKPILYKLTTDGASRSPAWSPDGTKLAYIGLEDATFDIYAADFSVTGTIPSLDNIQRLTDNANVEAPWGLSWGR
ncbi:MAG: TolB protein [Chloroflexia bacterium]|jgi:TolB protein|nr:TolB protein [Chloroflexia bacterium]